MVSLQSVVLSTLHCESITLEPNSTHSAIYSAACSNSALTYCPEIRFPDKRPLIVYTSYRLVKT